MDLFKKFGQVPGAKRKAAYKRLANYKNGKFQNETPTQTLVKGGSILKIFRSFLDKRASAGPGKPVPSVHTDLKSLKPDENVLIWFGHSSYFIQADGRKLLVDPVFSGSASPVNGLVKVFPGSNQYQADDMPPIDVLLITHDHWDHLDYPTLQKLRHKVSKVVCGLGVGQHFEYWGWDRNKLIERNWYESADLGGGIGVTLTPARHFSGRLLSRNSTLWTSFVLQTPSFRLFLGGDSGYGPHFKEIGDRFGPFDLAILECGQYNKKWPYIHSLPDEVIKEAQELRADNFMPVHNSKFKLAPHPWYEPLQQVTRLAEENNIAITTPRIGEKADLDHMNRVWDKWWKPLI